MHGAILLVSENSRIEFVNNIFCQYFNLSEQPADLVGITASEMIKKICNVYSDPDRAIAQIKEIIEMREPVIGEEVELTGGRTCIRDFIPLSISGKTYGRLWYHVDITERKKTEKTLKKAHDTLEEKVKERTAELQKAFELLKKNENDLAEAQKIARLGNWEWDITTDKIYWSEEVYRIFGRSPKEFDTTYMSFLSFIHPDDRNNVNNAVTETLSGKPYSIDYRVIQASGEERVVNAQGEASFGEDNTPVRLFGTVQDITDRKRDEETLRKSEKRYRLLHDNLRDAFAEVTMDGQVIDFNNQFCEILGYSPDELRTMSFKDLTPDRWHAFEEKIIREQVIPCGYSEIYEKEYRRKDGTVSPVELRTVLTVDDAGQPISMWAIMRDITERKIAEESLRLSEERYRSFIENFKGIAFQADENFIPIFLHGTIEEITGYREEELISKQPSWKEIVYPQDQPSIYEEGEKIKNSQNRTSGEIDYRIIRRDGKIKWVHEIHQKIPGNDENPDKYQGAIYDITKRKEAEETLAKIEITRKQEIHHRIKNNLQVISSLLDLQAEKFNGKKSIQNSEVLEAFKKSQDRVISMALIHEELHKGGEIDTLNFSRYIEELADNLLLTYRVGEKDIILNTDIEEDIFFNMDTAVPLGIIVNELVSNSLKHAFTTMDKGEIKIKLCREAGINTNFILIASDNGIGIPEDLDIEDLDSLGLQLVTTLVDQLDGEFELKRNNGNEFIIRFIVTEKDNQASLPAPYY
jgi:PAS domain S-box-containing protein